MKTAMQELIELIVNNKTRLDIIEKNQQMWLEKEKQQIIHTYWVSYKEGRYSGDKTAEEYYNETYKNEG
jgi:hypothetical protein